MSNASNDIPAERLVKKTAAQILADWRPEDDERLRRTDALSDEEIARRAQEDPDNPPLTDDQLSRMAAGSMPGVRAALLLNQVKDEATLLALLRGVTERLIADHRSARKAG